MQHIWELPHGCKRENRMSWTHLIETVKNTYNVQEQKPLVEKKESDQPKNTEQKSSQQVNNSKRVDVLV